MDKPKSTMAQQIAQAAIAFEQRRTGNHVPKSVTVVLSEGTLVITLHEALSPAEKALAQSPAGAAQMQEFHRQLFANSSDSLRQEISRITGMEVREATAESSRPAAPSCRRSRPATWCKCSNWPAASLRKRGVALRRADSQETHSLNQNGWVPMEH